RPWPAASSTSCAGPAMPRPDLASMVDALGLPSPERARILQEIAADFEDMRAELVRRGMDAPDAEAEALRLLAPSDAVIAALASRSTRRSRVAFRPRCVWRSGWGW